MSAGVAVVFAVYYMLHFDSRSHSRYPRAYLILYMK